MLIAFVLLLVFFLSSRVKLSHKGHYSTLSFILQIWQFAARICRGCLPWVFYIRKRITFCICEQILFIWKQTFFICEQNFLICEVFFINSVSFCYFRGSYGPPYFSTKRKSPNKKIKSSAYGCKITIFGKYQNKFDFSCHYLIKNALWIKFYASEIYTVDGFVSSINLNSRQINT